MPPSQAGEGPHNAPSLSAPIPPSAPIDSSTLSVGSFIRFGWGTFKKQPLTLLGALLVVGGVQLFAFIVVMIVGFVSTITGVDPFGQIFGFVTNLTVGALTAIGMISFFLKAHDSIETVHISDLWHPQAFWRYLGMMILMYMILLLGFLFFIVPGIIAALMFVFAPYLVVDKGLGPIAALKESARITKGNKWRLFAFSGASCLIMLLGLLALYVGLFVAVPVMALAMAHAYRRISAAIASGAPRQKLSGGEIVFATLGFLVPVLIVGGILASIVLASLSVAREKGREAQTQADLAALQFVLEGMYQVNGYYPDTLENAISEAVTIDPVVTDLVSGVPLSDFAYVVGEDGSTYGLCAPPAKDGKERCVNSEPVTTGDAL
jgi:uncharacterized membrane protein